jgi:CheY-like chemotaxis protein
MDCGIQPLDERVGEFAPGGVYVIAGPPGSGKFTSVLQFLNAGVQSGDRLAFLARTQPKQVLEQAQHWGFQLEPAWKSGQLRLLGFHDNFERLLLRTTDPDEVFQELAELVGPDVQRVGIDPARPIWETRAGTALGSRFVQWAESSGATTWATIEGDLSDALSPATEWVLQSAAGVLKIERLPDGLRQIWIRRFSPPPDAHGPVTLELLSGKGLATPLGRLDRRSTDAPIGSESRLALLKLAADMPHEVLGWARRRFEVFEVDRPLRLITSLHDGESFGGILIFLDRAHSREAVEACRALRPLTAAPIVLAADDRLRAGDRTDALDAGANDFLSDNFSFVELTSRLDRAARTAQGLPPVRKSVESEGGEQVTTMLDASAFATAVVDRLAEPDSALFTLLLVRPQNKRGETLGEVLLQTIRSEMGDFVGRTEDGYGVLLQGARPSQASSFLSRVTKALKQTGTETFEVEVLNGATEADRIGEVLPVESR